MGLQVQYLIGLFFTAWLMGLVFDVYNTVTASTGWLRWMQPLLDLLFWVSSACLVYYLLFWTDDGRFRIYTLFLLGIGYAFYRTLLHRRVVSSSFAIVRAVRVVFLWFVRLIWVVVGLPIAVALKLLWRVARNLYRMLCRLEDGLFWMMKFWLKVIHWPLRGPLKRTETFRAKIAGRWEGIWTRVSNWLKKSPVS